MPRWAGKEGVLSTSHANKRVEQIAAQRRELNARVKSRENERDGNDEECNVGARGTGCFIKEQGEEHNECNEIEEFGE